MQDAALVAMRSEVVAETTKLRNQQLEDARQGLQQQVQQEVSLTQTAPVLQQHSLTYTALVSLQSSTHCKLLGGWQLCLLHSSMKLI